MGTLKALWFFLAWALLFQEGTAAIEYCNPEALLTTDFMVPLYEESRTVKGCNSTELDRDNGFKVVVVRTKITSGDVLLTLTDISTKGVVIVLDSPVPIRWRLSFYGNSIDEKHERHVVMTPGSTLVEPEANIVKNLNDEYKKIHVDSTMPDEKFGTLVRQYYGGLTVFAQVFDANRVSLSLSDKASKVPSECNLSSLAPLTDVCIGFYVHKQKMFGCYHPNLAGTMASDVHVIDLMAAAPSPAIPLNNLENDQRVSRATSPNQLPPVFVSMIPKETKSGKIIDDSPRNITLILKSSYPVKWHLESWKMKGHLTVISTSQVEKNGLSPDQHLTVEPRLIMSGLSKAQQSEMTPKEAQLMLWRSILSLTGSTPISYIRVQVANVLQMVIPPKAQIRVGNRQSFTTTQDNFVSNFVPDPLSLDDVPVADTGYAASPVIPEKSIDKNSETDVKMVEKDLEDLVVKECDQKETVVTLPIESVAKFNVTSMTLSEEGCQAIKNQTHWVLKTRSTSCGSLNAFIGNNPIMNNAIYLQFAPGSEFHGKRVRVPFTCKFAPGLWGESYADDFEVDDHYDDDNDNDDSSDDEMYTMKVLRKRKRPNHSQVLVSRRGDHNTVFVGDELKVQTDFHTRLPASLMIEKCWIGDHPDAVDRSVDSGKFLIYEGCPANKNVTMLPVPYGQNPSFTFTVNTEHRRMGQIYIFCVLGLCTPVKSLTAGNLIECVDPVKKCAEDNEEWHVGPAAQQLSRRGPLYVTDQRLTVRYDSPSMPDSAQEQKKAAEELHDSPGLHSSHVVMVGVPAEIAVAISLASFLIGAALTGMLCRIHQRRSLKKTETRSSRDSDHGNAREMEPLQPKAASTPTNNGLSTMTPLQNSSSTNKFDVGVNA